MTEANAYCPKGGKFYVCKDKTRFFGCCTIDPCKTENGICPDGSLQPTTFDNSSPWDIPPQNYTARKEEALFYQCFTTNPPFMGCCTENPCHLGGCPTDSLRAARLGWNEHVLICLPQDTRSDSGSGSSSGTTSTALSTTAASMTTATPTTIESQRSASNNRGLSNGAVAGIAVGSTAGGLVGLFALGLVLFRRARKRRLAEPPSKPSYQVGPAQSEAQFPPYFSKNTQTVTAELPVKASQTAAAELEQP